MKFGTHQGAALLTLALTLTACGTSTTEAQPSSSSLPQQAMMQSAASARTGTFEAVNDKHVAGKVNIAAGELVLSDFSSDEAPDLHIYLANGTDPGAVAAGKELGSLAFDQAAQTFSISGVDASKYDTVVIADDAAKTVLGAAKLTP